MFKRFNFPMKTGKAIRLYRLNFEQFDAFEGKNFEFLFTKKIKTREANNFSDFFVDSGCFMLMLLLLRVIVCS